MSTTQTVLDLDQVCVNTVRTLAIDAIQQANSGHPGTPMGMSPTVYCLWQRLLRFDPEDPIHLTHDVLAKIDGIAHDFEGEGVLRHSRDDSEIAFCAAGKNDVVVVQTI